MTHYKNDIINYVTEVTGFTKANVSSTLDAVFDYITEVVSNKEDVQITNFGTFKAAHREARTCKNPQTGEPINIPERYVPSFKAGKAFKDSIK